MLEKIRQSEKGQQLFIKEIKELVDFGYLDLDDEDDIEMSDDIRTAYEGLGYVKDQELTFEDVLKIYEAIEFYVSPYIFEEIVESIEK